MPRTLLLIIIGVLGMALIVGSGIWLTRARSQGSQRPTVTATNRPMTITGLLSQTNGLFALTQSTGADPIYIANSHDQVIMNALAPLIGQIVTASGKLAANDVDTFYLESVNNQTLTNLTSPSPAPGLKEVFANLPVKQQNCLTDQLAPDILTNLLADPAYQLTPAQTTTLDTCLSLPKEGL